MIAAAAAGCADLRDATPYPGACRPLQTITWTPAGQSLGAPVDSEITVAFDDYPDPDTVGSDTLLLTTGLYWVPGRYRVDLLARTAAMRPWRGLNSNLGYTVHLGAGLRSLAGCATTDTTRVFRTGDRGGAPVPPPPPPFGEVLAMFGASCSGATCHVGTPENGGGCLAAPAAGISLCPDEAWDALVDAPSRQDVGLALVRPGDAARSQLLRKLLPLLPDAPPPPTTRGHRNPGDRPLSLDQLRALSRWIDAGANR